MSESVEIREKVKRKPLPFLLLGPASALYALVYTVCLYQNASGITYPFFVAATLCYFCFCMKKCGVAWREQQSVRSFWFHAVSILLLGLTVCLSDDYKVHGMSKTGIFLLGITFALRCFFQTQGWSFGSYLTAIRRSLTGTLCGLGFPFADGGSFWVSKRGEGKTEGKKYLLLTLAGFFIAIPMLMFIAVLMMTADPVFEGMVDRLLVGFDPLWAVRLIRPVLLTAVVFAVSYSFVANLLERRGETVKSPKRDGEPVLAITFTGLIALLYLVFCSVQVVYLFLGNGTLPAGLTWSAYARQGFFQLLFLCLFNLILVLVCLGMFRESRVLKAILTAISLMTYVLIASSAYRMALYVQYYYLTFLRLFVFWSLAVIGIALAGVIWSIFKEGFPLFSYCTAVVTVCYLLLAFSRPDAVVARYDLANAAERAQEQEFGEYMTFSDYGYLMGLSADAVPAMVEYASFGASAEQKLHYFDSMHSRAEQDSVRSFNFSRWRAKRYLEKLGSWMPESQKGV